MHYDVILCLPTKHFPPNVPVIYFRYGCCLSAETLFFPIKLPIVTTRCNLPRCDLDIDIIGALYWCRVSIDAIKLLRGGRFFEDGRLWLRERSEDIP